jgi:hypothetical protein
VLFSAGAGLAGGSLAVRLTAYRVYLFPVSVLALAAGFYLAYVKRLGPRWNRVVLWIATILSAFLWPLPYLLRWLR